MTQATEVVQSKDEPSSCTRNHIALAARLFFVLLIPLVGLFLLVHLLAGSERTDSGSFLFFWAMILAILGLALWQCVDLIRKKGVIGPAVVTLVNAFSQTLR